MPTIGTPTAPVPVQPSSPNATTPVPVPPPRSAEQEWARINGLVSDQDLESQTPPPGGEGQSPNAMEELDASMAFINAFLAESNHSNPGQNVAPAMPLDADSEVHLRPQDPSVETPLSPLMRSGDFPFFQDHQGFQRAICAPLSDAWLVGEVTGRPLLDKGPQEYRVRDARRASLVEYAQNYYQKTVDNTEAAQTHLNQVAPLHKGVGRTVQAKTYLARAGLAPVQGGYVEGLSSMILNESLFAQPGVFRVTLNDKEAGASHQISILHAYKNGRDVYKIFDADSGVYTRGSAAEVAEFFKLYISLCTQQFNQAGVMRLEKMPSAQLSPTEVAALEDVARPGASQGVDEAERDQAHVAMVREKQDQQAQVEVKSKLSRFRNFLACFGKTHYKNDAEVDPYKLALEDVSLVGGIGKVQFRDLRNNRLLAPITLDPGSKTLAVLKDYLVARQASGAIDTLSKATLNALLNAPEEPNAPPAAGQTRMLRARLEALRLQEATAKLLEGHLPSGRWAPVLDSLQPQVGGGYRILVINRDAPQQTAWKTTNDGTFAKFKSFIDQELAQMGKGFGLSPDGELQVRHEVGAEAAVNGLNSAFTVQALLRWFSAPERGVGADTGLAPDLATTLKLHSYLNNAQIGLGVIDDAAKIAKLTQMLGSQSSVLASTAASVEGLAGKAGALLSIGSVVFDSVELAKAPPEMRARFIAQLVADSANAGLSGASIIGAASGTSIGLAVAEFAGPVGVLLAGLGIAVNALVDVYGGIARNAASFGATIRTWYDNQRAGGARYDAENKILAPLSQVVVRELDLINGRVSFDSPRLNASKHGKSGSGKINFFLGVNDRPWSVRDPKHALNLRERFDLSPNAALPAGSNDAEVVILPATPLSYADYSYNTLPFATARNDAGFDLLRSLEGDDFDFDYYTFPSEYIIDKVFYYYKKTPVKVTLGSTNRRLQMQEMPKAVQRQNLMSYDLQAVSGEYVLGLRKGGSLRLTSVAPERTEWVLDAHSLESDALSFNAQGLNVGGVQINIPDAQRVGTLRLLGKNGDVRNIDLAQARQDTVVIDASKWNSVDLTAHLQQLQNQHQVNSPYLVVDNYTAPDGTKVARALYEVAKQRYIYLPNAVEHPDAELALQHGDDVYYYTHGRTKLLKLNANSLQVTGRYYAESGRPLRLWQQGNDVMLAAGKGEQHDAAYRVGAEGLELKQVRIDRALLGQMRDSENPLEVLKREVLKQMRVTTANGRTVAARIPQQGHLLVDYVDGDMLKQRYWLNRNDGTMMRATDHAAPRAPASAKSAANDQTLRVPLMA